MRSRLLYSIQAWALTEAELDTLEVIWTGFLRRMVKGGYVRKNVPTDRGRQGLTDKDLDWRFELSNDRLREITQTLPIRNFCYRQHVKYIGHVCRLENNTLQKQVLFNIKNPRKVWSKIETVLGVDVTQARRAMMSKTDILLLLERRLPALQQ